MSDIEIPSLFESAMTRPATDRTASFLSGSDIDKLDTISISTFLSLYPVGLLRLLDVMSRYNDGCAFLSCDLRKVVPNAKKWCEDCYLLRFFGSQFFAKCSWLALHGVRGPIRPLVHRGLVTLDGAPWQRRKKLSSAVRRSCFSLVYSLGEVEANQSRSSVFPLRKTIQLLDRRIWVEG